MSSYLLDTNHLSPLVTIRHPLRDRILDELHSGHSFAATVPVLNEFLFGIRSLPRAHENVRIWEQLKTDFVYYSIDPQDAEQAVEFRINLMRQGRQLGVVDSFVAAAALRYGLTLLTKDKDFLVVPQLKQENWLV